MMRSERCVKVGLVINGERIEKEVRPDLTLLRFLRDELGLTGTKEGCGQGQCGTCTVLVDGKAMHSCVLKVSRLNGRRIETIEGLSIDEGLHPIQEAFLETGAVQCGFCTPGMIMGAKALLAKNPSPSAEEIKKELKGNLCRCTGYVKVIDAIKAAAERISRRESVKMKPFPAFPDHNFIGASLPDVDGTEKVRGKLGFADDLSMDGMGYGKIVWSSHPHAEILSVETSRAKAMKGVRAVLTAKDVPGRNGVGNLNPDQPVLADRRVRFLGDPVVLVVADTLEEAEAACAAVTVTYRKLGGVFSPQDAMKPGAPLIQENGNIRREIHHSVGDVEKGFSEADLIVEEDYSTPFIDHAYLELESGIASMSKDGKVTIWTPTQGPFEVRKQVSAVLGVAEEKVRVIGTPLGGGFGGRISVTIQPLLALGAYRTKRPVKLRLTREEVLRFRMKKHASQLHYKTGFTKDGRIVANRARIVLDTGPYTGSGPLVLDQACIFSCGPYKIPNAEIEGLCVFTNNGNGGAMRGLGINQVAFAMEQQMDIAAEKLGIDPFQLRLINGLEIGDSTISGEILRASVAIKETIREAKRALDSALRPSKKMGTKRLGIGMASGFKNVGVGKGTIDNAGAILELTEGGKIRLYVSTVDMGQGNRTAMVQVCAQELECSPDRIEIVTGDTDQVLEAVAVVGQRATYCAGNAVILAAREFRKRLIEKTSKEFAISAEDLVFRRNGVLARVAGSDPVTTLKAMGQLLAHRGETMRVECNYRAPRTYPITFEGMPESGTAVARYESSGAPVGKEEYRNYPGYAYVTSVATVEVDESTGEATVKKVISAVDVGKAINPQKIEGQIEGSVVMGMGYALSEKFEYAEGVPVTDTLGKCGLPRMDQTPEMTTVIIEDQDPGGPYGAKGVSEVANVPVTPAIVSAIYDAVGVRIHDLPATKDKILEALKTVKQIDVER